MSTMLTNAYNFAGRVVIFVIGTVIGWMLYGVYKLGMWLVGSIF